jgi:uncharacterized LabA/DUF88 family protein
MFKPKTDRLNKLTKICPKRIGELEKIFVGKTKVYLDFANVYHWSNKLGWHIDLRRLKQLCDSFTNIVEVNWYNGTLIGDSFSEQSVKDAWNYGYRVVTKPVKLMRLSVDVSGIPLNSPAVLENFIKRPLLRQFTVDQVEQLNGMLKEINGRGVKYIEHRKCNFDVEMGRDIAIDYEKGLADTYILWTGDSDFADSVSQLIKDGKKVVIFATARRVSVELEQTGAQIFDIQKIRNFICRVGEIQMEIKNKL